jgi:hypothetical protein
MPDDKIKVVYIAGETRSGSTILSNILGEIDGFFNAGELYEFWTTGLKLPCSCGESVEKCKIWSEVLNYVFSDKAQLDVEEVIRMRNKAAQSKKVPKFLLIPYQPFKIKAYAKNYLNALKNLYQSIQFVSNSRVIIDASKNVGYCYILGLLREIELYMVHLVRDARATAYSWIQKKDGIWTEKPAKLSLRWVLRNLTAEQLGKDLVGKYMKLHYEDFIKEPIKSIENILKLINESSTKLPFTEDNKVQLREGHGICGNPNRFKRDLIKLELDERWKQMRKVDKYSVTLISWPLLLKYRYPINV